MEAPTPVSALLHAANPLKIKYKFINLKFIIKINKLKSNSLNP
jgi:hypothetical protein